MAENKDMQGGKGNYSIADEHTIVFISKYESDEKMIEVMDNIPNSDMMQVIITNPQGEESKEELTLITQITFMVIIDHESN